MISDWIRKARGVAGVSVGFVAGFLMGEQLEQFAVEFIDRALEKITFSDAGLFLLRLKPETRANLALTLREIAKVELQHDLERAVLFPENQEPS